MKIIITALIAAVTPSYGAISFFDTEVAWLASAGASASDVSSQTYDTAATPAGTYTTAGGTGGTVEYALGITPSRDVFLSTDTNPSNNSNDFRTGTSGQGIYFNTARGTGSAGVDVATMTITQGNPAFSDVHSFSFNVHDMFDTASGVYGFKVEIQAVGMPSVTVFDTGNAIAGIGGDSSASVAYTGPGGSMGSIILGDDSNANVGEDGNFFGFTSTDAIASITLTKTTVSDGNDNWAFDEFNFVSTSPVPEPSSVLLAMLGSVFFLGLRKRNS